MFEQMLLPTGGTHQGRTTVLAFILQALAIAFVIFIVPAIFVAQLPQIQLATELIAPPLPAPPPPPPPPAAAYKAPKTPATAKIVPRVFVPPRTVVAPSKIPPLPMVAEAPPSLPDAGVVGGVPGGVAGGVLGGTIGGSLGGSIGAPPAPLARLAPPQPQTASTIRVGGEVQAARLLHEVRPLYPAIARQARVSGVVHLSATIAPNGTVEDLHVLSGNPLLVDAAVSAVKQWTYKPTYLNGKPVQVLTDVDVKFTLG